jgi:hypothetical protein
MGPVFVIVTNVLFEKTHQMPFIECNHLIEQVAATALNPALRNSILPRALVGSLKRADVQRAYGYRNLLSVLLVAIEDEKAWSGVKRKGLSQLLYDPRTCRMPRDVEMQNPSPIVSDDEEAVEYAERDSRYAEEIHRRNHFTMIAQKRQPPLCGFWGSWSAAYPARDCSLADIEAEHEEFSVNAWRSPGWVFNNDLEDQLPYFF